VGDKPSKEVINMKPFFCLLGLFVVTFAVCFSYGRHETGQDKTFQPSVSRQKTVQEIAPEIIFETQAPFTWSKLESTNYQEFVNNLRAVRCPERTITEIVRADLMKLYAPKFAEVSMIRIDSNPRVLVREKLHKREAITAEIDAILKDLKLRRPVRSANALFTAEEEEKIAEAFEQFPRIRPDATVPVFSGQAKSNRVARLAFLSQHLSHERLLLYKLDRENDALRVNQLLGGMQPTDQEFLAVGAVIESLDTTTVNGQLKPDAIEALGKVLGQERLNLLQDLQKPEYRAIRNFALSHQLEPQAVNVLVSLRRNIFTQEITMYTERVKIVLTKPNQAETYLRMRGIHSVKQ
jgi:hypothetical protein